MAKVGALLMDDTAGIGIELHVCITLPFNFLFTLYSNHKNSNYSWQSLEPVSFAELCKADFNLDVDYFMTFCDVTDVFSCSILVT